MSKAIETMTASIKKTILDMVENDQSPFEKPWVPGNGIDLLPVNGKTGKAYKGFYNTLLLHIVARSEGYSSNRWVTFKQAKELGVAVRKGEKSTPVTGWFSKKLVVEAEASEDADKASGHKPLFPKIFGVFNEDQLSSSLSPNEILPLTEVNDFVQSAINLIEAVGVPLEFRNGDTCAYYQFEDKIRMVPITNFKSPEQASAVLLHELSHSVGPRLNREMGGEFGSSEYAYEECVAESSGQLTAMIMGLPYLPNHSAGYIAGWLRGKSDLLDEILADAAKSVQYIQKKAKAANWQLVTLDCNTPEFEKAA